MIRTDFPVPQDTSRDDIVHGVCAVIPGINVDTDAIFPKQFLKTIKRSGLEDALFADRRFLPDGTDNPEFVLNKPGFRSACILIGEDNFGCGSSREHAVWALKDFGIRVLISTSFGSIFRNNCVKNGVWPLVVSQQDLGFLSACFNSAQPRALTVHLDQLHVFPGDGTTIHAAVPGSDRLQLMSGQDEIDLTLAHADRIHAFEAAHHDRFPWLV